MDVSQFSNFIDNLLCDAADGATADLVDPTTGLVVAAVPESGARDVDRAADAAARAFGHWRTTDAERRSKALCEMAAGVESRADSLVSAASLATGRWHLSVSRDEVSELARRIRLTAGEILRRGSGDVETFAASLTSSARREPLGVVVHLGGSHRPFDELGTWVVPALAAGNTVVLKPAGAAVPSALAVAESAAEILPPGVLNVVCGGHRTGNLLAAHDVPALVTMCGSRAAAREVAARAAGALTRTHLDFRGTSLAVVLENADPHAAAEVLAEAAFAEAGQSSTSISRILVSSDLVLEFTAALVKRAEAQLSRVPGGPPVCGPLLGRGRLDSAVELLDRMPSHARVLAGGRVHDGPGCYLEPTVIADIRQDDELGHADVLGPVVGIQTFAGSRRAMGAANAMPHRRTASVWSTDTVAATDFARELAFPHVWVNTHPRTSAAPSPYQDVTPVAADLDRCTRPRYVTRQAPPPSA
ncbi:aldehyde dehydrogenase family protein [Actinacidiphila alni]|uniref:aldehyde dehydrogenase family protein n=1 Tax=Actinacidiphila alni TaxID=380248 RepID=UPI00340A69A0